MNYKWRRLKDSSAFKRTVILSSITIILVQTVLVTRKLTDPDFTQGWVVTLLPLIVVFAPIIVFASICLIAIHFWYKRHRS